MKYQVTLPLPEGWTSEQEEYEEVEGALITHLECSNAKENSAIDLYVGDMPSDTTAQDEAYANYADIIGWDDEDDEENPIAEWQFQKRKAFGFSGLLEDESIMLLMCVEIKKGALLIASLSAKDDASLQELAKYVEYHLRVK